ncbi:CvpA family protein [Algicola sagamiensis]|uniref:CvpA family protein n=1 Tax=Algicola sagamiensis TaxID=163869 RepID=UPI00037E204E|nr:CvpA family protein [Algicola sagamiensis]
MTWLDIAIIGVIGLSTLISLVRGFTKEAISLVTWITAFFISSTFHKDLAVFMTFVADPTARKAAAIVSLFLLTLVLGAMVNYIFNKMISKVGLSSTDRALGMIFGGLRGVFIVSAVLFALDAFTPLPNHAAWQGSKLIPEFKFIIQWFFNYLQTNSSFLTQ